MMHGTIQILATEYLHDKAYVDLVIANGQIETHVMKKVAEPNEFKSVIEVPGDWRREVMVEMSKRVVN